MYRHHNRQGANIVLEAPKHDPLIKWLTWGHVTVWKIYISIFIRFISNKLGRLLTLEKIFITQTLKLSPTSCSFSPSRQCFWTDCRKFFRGGFKTSYWGSVWPRSNLLLGHTKNISVNIFLKVYIRDACGTWHGLFTITSIHSILKNTRNSQKSRNALWNKLPRREKPKKPKDVQKKQFIGAICEEI